MHYNFVTYTHTYIYCKYYYYYNNIDTLITVKIVVNHVHIEIKSCSETREITYNYRYTGRQLIPVLVYCTCSTHKIGHHVRLILLFYFKNFTGAALMVHWYPVPLARSYTY